MLLHFLTGLTLTVCGCVVMALISRVLELELELEAAMLALQTRLKEQSILASSGPSQDWTVTLPEGRLVQSTEQVACRLCTPGVTGQPIDWDSHKPYGRWFTAADARNPSPK